VYLLLEGTVQSLTSKNLKKSIKNMSLWGNTLILSVLGLGKLLTCSQNCRQSNAAITTLFKPNLRTDALAVATGTG